MGYDYMCGVVAISLDIFVFAVFDLRGWYLAIAVLLAWFPTLIFVMALASRTIPQKVKPVSESEPTLTE